MRFGVWRIDSGNTAVSSRTARGSCHETGAQNESDCLFYLDGADNHDGSGAGTRMYAKS
jgi:hypothetical protein